MADRDDHTANQKDDVRDDNVEQTAVPLGPETQAIIVLGLN